MNSHRRTRRFPAGLALVTLAMMLLFMAGCDLTNSTSPPEPTPQTWSDFPAYFPGAHLVPGYMQYDSNRQAYVLVSPLEIWQPVVHSREISLLQSNRIWNCLAVGYDTSYGGFGLTVLPLGWDNQLPGGMIFWKEGEYPSVRTPEPFDYNLEELLDAIRPLIAAWGDSLIENERLEIFQMGISGTAMMFWVSEIPKQISDEFSARTDTSWGGPVGYNGTEAWIETSFEAPNGFLLEEADVADLYDTGYADVISIPMRGIGAPIRTYLYTSNSEWKHIAQFYP